MLRKSKLRPAKGDQLLESTGTTELTAAEGTMLLELSSLLIELSDSTEQVRKIEEGMAEGERLVRREDEPGKKTPVPLCRRRGCSLVVCGL